jgi:hypothetical protein
MSILHHSPQPADRRLLAILRVPAQELGCSLPGTYEAVTLRGQALVLIDYALRAPARVVGEPAAPNASPLAALRRGVDRIWPARLGLVQHHLAIRIPVRPSGGDTRTTLWVPRRYTSSRLAASALAPRGHTERARRASFDLRLEGFQLELEVRTEQGRVVFLRGEMGGDLDQSIFQHATVIESLLREWNVGYRHASWCAGLDRPDVTSDRVALHPMHMHAFQSAVLPELFPGIEETIELDCVLRQVSQRPAQARSSRRAYLEELARGGDLDAPPAGAFSVWG